MGKSHSTSKERSKEVPKDDPTVTDGPKKTKQDEAPEIVITVKDGGSWDVIGQNNPKNKTTSVVFHWEYDGKEVFLSGSFDNWKAEVPMVKSGGKFTATLEIPSGTHEIKYLVDGNWKYDPNQNTIDDHYGGKNNVITVNEPEALSKNGKPGS